MIVLVGTFTARHPNRADNAQDHGGKYACNRSHHHHAKNEPPSVQWVNVTEENYEPCQPCTGYGANSDCERA